MNQRKFSKALLPVIGLALLVLALAGCGGSSTAPGVTITGGDTQAILSWPAVSGATSYNIYYSTTPGVTKATATNSVTGITATTSTVPALTDGTTYYFLVTVVTASGESSPFAEVSTTPIAKPSGITASAENNQATVAWLAVSGAARYNLYYNYSTTTKVTKEIPSPAAISGTTNTQTYYTYPVPNLTNGVKYNFYVTAVNSNGDESAASSMKSASPSVNGMPGSPVSVSLSSPAAGQVHVVWGDYVPDAASYNAYYLQQATQPTTATVLSTGTKVSLTAPSPNNLTTGFTSGLKYWFVVTAVNSNGVESGGQTSPKSVTP